MAHRGIDRVAGALALLLLPLGLEGQGAPFAAAKLFDTPTASTVARGELQFEIGHRFTAPVSTDDSFFGLDNGAAYRLGLTWGVSDRAQIGVIRTGVFDNVDVHGKLRLAEGATGGVRWAVALEGGWAWNTEVNAPGDPDTSQPHASAIVDLGLGRRLAVGASPTWVDNPDVLVDGEDAVFAVPLRARLRLTGGLSLFGEWTATEGTGEQEHDLGAFGIQLRTGGHFFVLGVSNGVRPNPSQYVVGAADPFASSELRFGFNITRRIRL